MTAELPDESIVRELELLLRLLCHYTDAQLQAVWERQLIPNEVVDGRRRAPLEPAAAYLEQALAAQRAADRAHLRTDHEPTP